MIKSILIWVRPRVEIGSLKIKSARWWPSFSSSRQRSTVCKNPSASPKMKMTDWGSSSSRNRTTGIRISKIIKTKSKTSKNRSKNMKRSRWLWTTPTSSSDRSWKLWITKAQSWARWQVFPASHQNNRNLNLTTINKSLTNKIAMWLQDRIWNKPHRRSRHRQLVPPS